MDTDGHRSKTEFEVARLKSKVSRAEQATDSGLQTLDAKLAQAMKGLSLGDKFQFQGEEFTITDIQSYLEK